MTKKEKNLAYILNIFFGYFLMLIAILILLLIFKVDPLYNFLKNIFYFESVHRWFFLIPAFLSVACFNNANKFK